MIEYMRIENFKTLLEAAFPLASLNLFSGLNGMGKSSLIQTLLLLRQSHERNTLKKKGLLLNGEYVKLGTGRDVLSSNSESERIHILVKWEHDDAIDYTFGVKTASDLQPYVSIVKGPDYTVQSLFSNRFQYLSADRISPESNYKMSEFHIKDLNSLGNHGEYTVHFIAENALKQLPIGDFKHEKTDTYSFLENLDAWMGEITPGIKINAKTQMESNTATLSYHFIQGKDKTAEFKPQNVGFGLTYALPVVTAILRSKPGDLLLIENPESHLHPAGQAMVGKLCCIAAANGVQLFIESHSDHFLNGVRVAVKQGLIKHDEVSVFFMERPFDQVSHSSIVHNPSIDENGRLEYWPEGFFDEWDNQLDKLI